MSRQRLSIKESLTSIKRRLWIPVSCLLLLWPGMTKIINLINVLFSSISGKAFLNKKYIYNYIPELRQSRGRSTRFQIQDYETKVIIIFLRHLEQNLHFLHNVSRPGAETRARFSFLMADSLDKASLSVQRFSKFTIMKPNS